MGIGGHVLGPRKLHRLSALAGLPFNRAIIRSRYAEGVVWTGPGSFEDEHYEVDLNTGQATKIDNPVHWSTCFTHSLENP